MELHFDGVTISVAGRRLIDQLQLTVSQGEIVGLVGPNGSGKSSALRSVYRALRPSDGVVRLGGEDLWKMPLRASAQHVAALTQEGGSDFDFTVEEVVALGRTPHKRGNEPLTASERDLCRTVMEQMGVLELADRGILELSGGERQRVLIARALAQQPTLLILDEPTNHLDLRHQIQLLERLRSSAPSVLIVLHDLNLAAATCDRIGVLSEGRLVATGAPRDVLTRELIADVFGVDVEIVPHPLNGRPQILFTLETETHEHQPANDRPWKEST